MSFSLFPKSVKFFDLFLEQNRKTFKAATILNEIVQDFTDVEEKCKQINIIEAEGNGICRNIPTLSITFITPIDREDIHEINIAQETSSTSSRPSPPASGCTTSPGQVPGQAPGLQPQDHDRRHGEMLACCAASEVTKTEKGQGPQVRVRNAPAGGLGEVYDSKPDRRRHGDRQVDAHLRPHRAGRDRAERLATSSKASCSKMPEIPLLLLVPSWPWPCSSTTPTGRTTRANAIATIVSTKVLSPETAVVMAAALNLAGAFMGDRGGQDHRQRHRQRRHGRRLPGPGAGRAARRHLLEPAHLVPGPALVLVARPHRRAHRRGRGLQRLRCPELCPSSRRSSCRWCSRPWPASWAATCSWWRSPGSSATPIPDGSTGLPQAADPVLGLHGHQPRQNDAQKTMGIITLALFIFHQIPDLPCPSGSRSPAPWPWPGHRHGRLEDRQDHGPQDLQARAHPRLRGRDRRGHGHHRRHAFGAPISTTHVISTSVLGVGASKRLSAVRWGVAGNMVVAWVMTIPAAAGGGGLFLDPGARGFGGIAEGKQST